MSPVQSVTDVPVHIDAQADEEDDERAFDAGGVAAWMKGGHMGRTIYRRERRRFNQMCEFPGDFEAGFLWQASR